MVDIAVKLGVGLRERARELRCSPTLAERVLWMRLRGRQLEVKFRRQLPVGGFIADFACLPLRLIVEVDGGQHDRSERDARRDASLRALGFKVVRYWNSELLDNTEGVVQDIRRQVAARRRELGWRESASKSGGEQ